MGVARHRLARARLRADALVGQGDGAHPAPVRRCRGRGSRRPRGHCRNARTAQSRGLDAASLLEKQRSRISSIDHYVDAYRQYVWPVSGVADLRLAPFHILAGETGVYSDRDHGWHLERCDRLVAADPGGCRALVGSWST